MSVPRVSVILAVYNGEAYVGRSVQSVLDQEYRDLELLVVDDGSTDRTREVLEEYATRDERVVLLVNGTNEGIVYSRNRALAIARGTLLAGQDADDISLPLRLKRQVDYLEANPDVGVVGTWAKFIDEQDAVLPSPGVTPDVDNDRLQTQLLDRSLFCAPTVVFRKEHLDLVGMYDPRLPYSHDYDLFLRLSEVTRMANIAEPLYLYRQHQSSVTSRHRPRQMYYKAQALGFAVHRRWGANSPAWVRELLARDYIRASYLACQARQAELAHETYAEGRAVMPTLSSGGSVLAGAISRYTMHGSATTHLEALDFFFDEVCDHTEHTSAVRAELASGLTDRALREMLEIGQTGPFDRLLWRTVRDKPGTVLSRNVLTLIGRRLFAPVAAAGDRA